MEERRQANTKAKVDAATAQATDPDRIPPGKFKLGDFTVPQMMEKIINRINPTIFSMSNLRSIMQKAGRARAKGFFSEILEYLCGTDDGFEVPAFIQTYTALAKLLLWFHGQIHGVRFLVSMPPDFSSGKDGHFDICWMDVEVPSETVQMYPHLMLKNEGVWKPVPRQDLPKYFGPGSLYIQGNHSLITAVLRARAEDDSYSIRCCRMFAVKEPLLLLRQYKELHAGTLVAVSPAASGQQRVSAPMPALQESKLALEAAPAEVEALATAPAITATVLPAPAADAVAEPEPQEAAAAEAKPAAASQTVPMQDTPASTASSSSGAAASTMLVGTPPTEAVQEPPAKKVKVDEAVFEEPPPN